MSEAKRQIRKAFSQAVFKRDGYRCKICGTPDSIEAPLDAHHITDRTEIVNGGYVKENGITLCHEHHKAAERFHTTLGRWWVMGFHPDDLYKLINSSYEQAVEASKKL